MHDPDASLQAGVDPRRWADLLRRAHETTFSRGRTPSIVRDVVADSWERCTSSGLTPDAPAAPLAVDPVDARARWEDHPLSQTADLLRSVLAGLLHDARHILVVGDADGTLLWSEGHPDVLRASDAIQFSPGYSWAEDAAGTNAIGTALAAGRPVQIFSAEHFRSAVHAFQCSGAPIRDPDSGEILGVIDVTGSYRTGHPHNLALVQTAARLAEERLRSEMLERHTRILGLFAQHASRHGGPSAALTPSGRVLASTHDDWRDRRFEVADGRVVLPDGSSGTLHDLGEGLLLTASQDGRSVAARTSLSMFGRPFVLLRTPSGEQRLTGRHGEIVTVLALNPDGLTSAELAEMLYGDRTREVTVRAEMHRLRDVLGPALATRPYRLRDVDSDLASTLADLRDGDVARARARVRGALLPGSHAPAVVAAREALSTALTPAVA